MKKMAILGCGNMSRAILLGYKKKYEVSPYQFIFFNPTIEKAISLKNEVGGDVIQKITELPPCDFYLFACKPQQFEALANEIKGMLPSNSTIISVMAGVTLETLQKELKTTKIFRTMPNIASEIGQGMTLCYAAKNFLEDEKKEITSFFESASRVYQCQKEEDLDYLSAITCLAPAYLYELCAELVKCAGKKIENAEAFALVFTSIMGAIKLMEYKEVSPENLTKLVASKGGMTLAALEQWKNFRFSSMIESGIDKAYERAKTLGAQVISR